MASVGGRQCPAAGQASQQAKVTAEQAALQHKVARCSADAPMEKRHAEAHLTHCSVPELTLGASCCPECPPRPCRLSSGFCVSLQLQQADSTNVTVSAWETSPSPSLQAGCRHAWPDAGPRCMNRIRGGAQQVSAHATGGSESMQLKSSAHKCCPERPVNKWCQPSFCQVTSKQPVTARHTPGSASLT